MIPLEQHVGAARINGFTPYASSATHGLPHVLFSLNNGVVYDIGLDGSNVRRLPLTVACSSPTVTPDGNWLACLTRTGIALASIVPGALAAGREIIHTQNDHLPQSLSWSPDGQELAAVNVENPTCSIALYTEQDAYSQLRLTAILSIPGLIQSPGIDLSCALYWVSWSPDGHTLLLAADQGIYLLSLALVPSASAHPGNPPTSVTFSLNQLTVIGIPAGNSTPVWSPVPQFVTINYQGVNTITNTIDQLDTKTGKQAVILTIRSQGLLVCGPSWVPSRHQLVFSLCEPVQADYPANVLEALYVFTPAP